MARVTVEDCILVVPNRFELVMVAAQRARHIAAGATLTMGRDNDKNPVVALREIAERTVDPDSLRQSFVQGLQKQIEVDEPEEDKMELLAPETELAAQAFAAGAATSQEPADEDEDDSEARKAGNDAKQDGES